MFTLVHLDTPPPESLKSQVLQMVVDYFSDLSPVPLTASNPLYQLYQYVIGYQVHLYLSAMDSSQPGTARLSLALDDEDPSQVLGFALFLPSTDDTQACTLAYLGVRASHRRRGIARALVQYMIKQRPHAELACSTAQVPTFEALGFQVRVAQGPHVVMNTRTYRSGGLVAVQDLDYRSTEVRQIHAYLVKQYGELTMSDAERQRDHLLDQMTLEAQALVRDKIPTLH